MIAAQQHIPDAPRFECDGYETEKVVLGCLLLYADLWDDRFSRELFVNERHQAIAHSICILHRRGTVRDVVAIARELKRHPYYSPNLITWDINVLMECVTWREAFPDHLSHLVAAASFRKEAATWEDR